MVQEPNKLIREQNRIKIYMKIGQSTKQNLNIRWFRNRSIPVTTPQVPTHISYLNLGVPSQSNFSKNNPPQESDLQFQDPVSVGKPRP